MKCILYSFCWRENKKSEEQISTQRKSYIYWKMWTNIDKLPTLNSEHFTPLLFHSLWKWKFPNQLFYFILDLWSVNVEVRNRCWNANVRSISVDFLFQCGWPFSIEAHKHTHFGWDSVLHATWIRFSFILLLPIVVHIMDILPFSEWF